MKRFILTTLTLLIISISFAQNNNLSIGVKDSIKSIQLSETRYLNIYLPEGYTTSDTQQYAVIYLLDGGMDEDFIHVAGLVQFNTLAWVNRMPPSIVVGIVNVDRKRDMTYPTTVETDKQNFPTTGGSEKFISFIEEELQPYIRKNYKTNGNKMLIGQSLGGLLATEILFNKPELFQKYLIISPSLWWDNGSLLDNKTVLSLSSLKTKTSVYLAVGKEGLTPSNPPRVMEVDANLLAEKITELQNKQIDLTFDYLRNENHATITHQAVFNGIRALYPQTKH